MPHCDMKNYITVFRVLMMAVAIPLTGFNMDLDVSCYYLAVDSENSVSEITTTAIANSTWMDYLKLFTGISNQVGYQVALPNMRNQLF